MNFYSASSLKQQFIDVHGCHSTQKKYPDLEPTGSYSKSLMLCA